MKIALAQTRPKRGDIKANLEDHVRMIYQAIAYEAEVVIFSELSLTGYEPSLAKALALKPNDPVLPVFQELSNHHKITLGIGLPTASDTGTHISMALFQPNETYTWYSKNYLHADEEPFFTPENRFNGLLKKEIALAICYELSVPEHAEAANDLGAKVYLTSVAKTETGVKAAHNRLSQIAKNYSVITLMVNAVGPSDDFISAGKSAVWDQNGVLLGQLSHDQPGILILDTTTLNVGIVE